MTIVSEVGRYCGPSGRVRRVFWRDRTAWVVVRFRIGGLTAVPWGWTDLPVPELGTDSLVDDGPAVLLSPVALCDLVRFLRNHEKRSRDKNISVTECF